VAFSREVLKRRRADFRVLGGGERSFYQTGVRALVLAVATFGGVGYFPVASGTAGALAALPLLPLLAALRARSLLAWGATIVVLVAVAIWAAGRAEEVLG